ncbi:hypothetical protein LNP20_00790 [Klebsiella pneumoniae subsp. pneumoniae]|nr:hypothetical protein [Klebsiella pneumoniae subsp. pneumoniae]
MLGFISDNVDDAVAICFSRSKNGGGFNSDEEHKFSKYDAVIYAVNYLSRTLPSLLLMTKNPLETEGHFVAKWATNGA